MIPTLARRLGTGAAAAVAVGMTSAMILAPTAVAQDDRPPGPIRVAICANVSVASISDRADQAVGAATGDVEAATRHLAAVQAASIDPNGPGGATVTETEAGLIAAAKQRLSDANARLATAQIDQRDAQSLESSVLTFLGGRDFAAIKRRLCDDAPPTTTVAPPPVTTVVVVPNPIIITKAPPVPRRINTGHASF